MWAALAQGGLSDLVSLFSPGLWSLLPARDVEHSLVLLLRNHRHAGGLEAAKAARRDSLTLAGLPIELDADGWHSARSKEKMGSLSGLQLPPREVGARVLRLYFHQLYAPHPTLLDLRSTTFAQTDGTLWWSGGGLYVEWDAAFLAGLREVQLGHYRNDQARFRRALGPLGLASAEDELWRYFHDTDPTNQAFDVAEFRRGFVALLKRCQDTGARLHPDFVPFGIYLGSLYQHLTECGGSHDVLSAFNDVQSLLAQSTGKGLAAQSAAL